MRALCSRNVARVSSGAARCDKIDGVPCIIKILDVFDLVLPELSSNSDLLTGRALNDTDFRMAVEHDEVCTVEHISLRKERFGLAGMCLIVLVRLSRIGVHGLVSGSRHAGSGSAWRLG